VSDIFSPKPVFTWGLLGLGICNLIISFLPNAYSFYVFRAISGLCGSCLVPAAFRLIVNVFPPEELNFAFTVYGVSGSISNSLGILLGGIVQLVPGTGQMIAWRWYFRISAAIM
jgi:MFS family permease